MKKIVVVLMIFLVAFQLAAEFDFYGSIRLGWWYQMTDEDYNSFGNRLEFMEPFYKDSRLGVTYNEGDFRAKLEMGIAETNMSVREAYVENDFGKFKLLVGRTSTALCDLTSQVYDTDRAQRGYGSLWDNYNNQIKISLNCGGYLILAEPIKSDPAGLGLSNLDALIPKVNFGRKFNFGSVYLHPSVGVNFCQYNKDAAGIDETILSYILATTIKYDLNNFCVKLQASYGQNTGDYGMKRAVKGSQGYALWDAAQNEVVDTNVITGYFEAKFTDLTAGLGYISETNDTLDDADAAASLFLQYKYDLTKHVSLIPEAGILDHMEDGLGNSEGRITYFGTEIRATF